MACRQEQFRPPCGIGLGFGFGFRVWGSGFGVPGVGMCRIEGLGRRDFQFVVTCAINCCHWHINICTSSSCCGAVRVMSTSGHGHVRQIGSLL